MIKTVTGSTGDRPVQDSLSRGLFVAAAQGVLTFVANKTGALTLDDMAYLTPAVTLLAFLAWGLWDRWGKPRLPGA